MNEWELFGDDLPMTSSNVMIIPNGRGGQIVTSSSTPPVIESEGQIAEQTSGGWWSGLQQFIGRVVGVGSVQDG